MVALPKKWVREMGLQQGSEVMITRPTNTSLLISAEVEAGAARGREAVIEVDADDAPESTFRKIVSLYVLGYSQITIAGTRGLLSSSKKVAIKELVRKHLIGTEGVAESREMMTVHVLLGYSELSVENALKKMLLIINSMRKDATQALESMDPVLAEAVVERQDEVKRFELYVIRELNMSQDRGISSDARIDQRDTLGYIQVARMLERIAYHVCKLTKAVTDLDKPLSKATISKIIATHEASCELVDQALLSLFKRDHAGADAVIDSSREFVDKEGDAVRVLDGADSKTFHTLHVILDGQVRVAEYARDIAENVLDMTIERVTSSEELVTPHASV